jgi:hypothetical protein
LRHSIHLTAALGVALLTAVPIRAQVIEFDRSSSATQFPIATNGRAASIYVAAQNPETVRTAAEAFASDVERVTGIKPQMLTSLPAAPPPNLILVGVLGHSPEIDRLATEHKLDAGAVSGKWESAVTTIVADPLPGVRSALVIAGSDRRGAAFALFTLSRQMGVSPWTWWADVPVAHHAAIYVHSGTQVQREPSVQYRGIFLNDEDWGLRPWAAKKMDPEVDGGKGNIGPHTYEHIFELLLRLHANSLWPAMHPGSLAFNAVPENAKLADKWGIVMGSSHSEALLRNNVGEWNEAAPPKGNGPWNYQTNSAAMNKYWEKRLAENGTDENFYTVGLRGVHDSGLEATGTPEVKARLVEDAMTEQRKLLAEHVNPDLTKVPQVIWLYKESLDLYRVGMKVPDEVTLGWTDDNYGYIRELPNATEQKRSGGSGVYYHVSYWGSPHDYLWLCTTPPALIREEMTKAYDHNARKYWILNVGDLKPAEIDIDYFMQLAVDEPAMAKMSQHDFLQQWAAEQFPSTAISSTTGDPTKPGFPLSTISKAEDGTTRVITMPTPSLASVLADVMNRYYALNFIRKPEFMGFNGYNDGIKRTAFNPLAWGTTVISQEPPSRSVDVTVNNSFKDVETDQNRTRTAQWGQLREVERDVGGSLPPQYASAFFELVGYPVEGAAAMNQKFLSTDLTYLDAHNRDEAALKRDTANAHAAYDAIQSLAAKYNSIEGGKWDGIMSSAPRERHVFEMPRTATMADADTPLPASWAIALQPPAQPITPGFVEQSSTVSMNAAHFTRSNDGSIAGPKLATSARWNVLADLGISGASVEYGSPGLLANSDVTTATSGPQNTPWLEYDFTTISSGAATLTLHLLPTFPIDSDHRLRYAVSIDGHPTLQLDAATATSAKSTGAGDGPSGANWAQGVLRNSAMATMNIASLTPGAHTIRLMYVDPGVVFEHLVLTFPGAPPAYPVPPETTLSSR